MDNSPQTPERKESLSHLHNTSDQNPGHPTLFLGVEPNPIAIEDPFTDSKLNSPKPNLTKVIPPPSQEQPEKATIIVGDTPFCFRTKTMQKYSRFLANLFCCGRWNANAGKQCDIDYVISFGNVEMFTYLYDYMTTGVFPLFYQYHKGFDYAKYARLQHEAEVWGVDGMIDWVKGKKYEDAVQIQIEVLDVKPDSRTIIPGSVICEVYPRIKIGKTYVCPRGLPVHHGDKSKCGNACMKARGREYSEYEDREELRTMQIERKVIIHKEVLTEKRAG